MPRRLTQTAPGTHQTMKNVSFEMTVASWLMKDGWQVFTPLLDDGHQTDLLISDGPNYHRLQVKTVAAKGDDHIVENRWQDNSHVDVIIYFVRNSNWGVVAPAFKEESRPLNHPDHQRFSSGNRKEFLTAFHKL
jgi:hypothetical protein